jgi:hypothetical protein
MASYGYTFTSGDTVTPTKLNNARTVSEIVNADIAGAANIAGSKLEDGAITNAKVNASAAIAHTKLANITAGQVLLGNASNVPTATALSGDVTVNSSGVTAISSGVIVNADVNAAAAISLSKLATGALPAAITVASANLVDGTIVNADINAAAAIDLSKLATGALPSAITVASANLVDGTIVNADINASAAIADTKLATISTAGKVSNSATTATNANTANAIVARDASGNFSAGTITANLTGTASAIANGSVSTAKIVDANVTNAKLASDIDASKLTTGTLPIARIADDAVTDAKLSLAANAGEIKKALNADNSPPIFACRAWVNFDGTTVTNVGGEDRCTIRQSGNVAKVVRNATADYTITFTTAMPDVDYCVVAASRTSTATAKGFCSPVTYNTADVRILASGEISSGGLNYIGANSNVNHSIVNVAIFR